MSNRGTVFIVDDEPVIGDTIAAVLNEKGYDATAFERAALAVEARLKARRSSS